MDSENVCSSGQTGSDRRGVKMTRLTQLRLRHRQSHGEKLSKDYGLSAAVFKSETQAIAQALFRELASSRTRWTLPLKKRIKVREQYTYGL